MNRTLKMYGLVPYQLTGIQQGIQFGHAVVEYQLKYGDTELYKEWANNHKTFCILNGGTTNTNTDSPGTMNEHDHLLWQYGIDHACFFEPDLGDQLTALVWITDERVYDRKAYPNYNEYMSSFTDSDKELDDTFIEWTSMFCAKDNKELEKILFLREFQNKFRLA